MVFRSPRTVTTEDVTLTERDAKDILEELQDLAAHVLRSDTH